METIHHTDDGRAISNCCYGNNTNADLSLAHDAIMAAIKTGTELPEEISDLFTLTIVEVDDGIRGIIDWR